MDISFNGAPRKNINLIWHMHGTLLSLAELFLFFVDLQQQSRNVIRNLLDTSRMRGSIDCCASKADIGRGRNV
jgi:hypothetical protein